MKVKEFWSEAVTKKSFEKIISLAKYRQLLKEGKIEYFEKELLNAVNSIKKIRRR